MCSVLVFNNESDKLRSLFSESNYFDSILFIFNDGRCYKVPVSNLGGEVLRYTGYLYSKSY